MRRHAFLYIFSLRLLPAVPIWMVNIAAAFVKTPLWLYASATFLGILAPTLIYASVGASLDRVFASGGAPTLQSVFQPPVIASLFALGALALAPLRLPVLAGALPKGRRRLTALPKSRV